MSTLEACPVDGCGAAWALRGWTTTTLIGWGGAPPGHQHDPNCAASTFTCAGGHSTVVRRRPRCLTPDCTWVGKSECDIGQCHGSTSVDEWPAIPTMAPALPRVKAVFDPITGRLRVEQADRTRWPANSYEVLLAGVGARAVGQPATKARLAQIQAELDRWADELVWIGLLRWDPIEWRWMAD